MEVEICCFCKSLDFADPERMKFLCCLLPGFGPSSWWTVYLWEPVPWNQLSVFSLMGGHWTLNLCSHSRKWLKKNPGRLLLFKGSRQGTGGWDLYASKLERRWCWRWRENKNYKMSVGRAVIGSDLGIVYFQGMKNLGFVFILIWSGTHFHLWALKVLLPVFVLLWYTLLLPVVMASMGSRVPQRIDLFLLMDARQEVRCRSLWICAVDLKLCMPEYTEERLVRLWLSLVQLLIL